MATNSASSVLHGSDELGVLDRLRDLQAAVDRYEFLLRIARSPAQFPDFGGELNENKLLLGLAECRLCMCTLERTAWQLAVRTGLPTDEGRVPKLLTSLEEAQQLYQSPAVIKCSTAIRGQVRVLMETAELLAYDQRCDEAMTSFTDAIRLCYNIADEVTEAQITKRIKDLKQDADIDTLLNQLEASTTSSSEKQILLTAFEHVVGPAGKILKSQLKQLAHELSAAIVLRDDEVDEMWSQILAASGGSNTSDALATAEFGQVWRWWVKGDALGSLLFATSKKKLERKGTPFKCSTLVVQRY